MRIVVAGLLIVLASCVGRLPRDAGTRRDDESDAGGGTNVDDAGDPVLRDGGAVRDGGLVTDASTLDDGGAPGSGADAGASDAGAGDGGGVDDASVPYDAGPLPDGGLFFDAGPSDAGVCSGTLRVCPPGFTLDAFGCTAIVPVPEPPVGTDFPSSVLLDDGRVLVCGFPVDGGVRPAAFVVDGGWSELAPLAPNLRVHLLVKLTSGLVLALVQDGDVYLSQRAFIYRPDENAWDEVAAPDPPHYLGALTALADGRALATGGYTDPGVATAYAHVFDPDVGVWLDVPSMAHARFDHGAALLDDGSVVVAGGAKTYFLDDDAGVVAAERFVVDEMGWVPAGDVRAYGRRSSVIGLPDGDVLYMPMPGPPIADRFELDAGTWSPTVDRPAASYDTVSVGAGMSDGIVVFIAGAAMDGLHWSFNRALELFDPASGTWIRGVDLPGWYSYATAHLLADGRVFVVAHETFVASTAPRAFIVDRVPVTTVLDAGVPCDGG